MKRIFAVFRSRGPEWQDARPLEEQQDWQGHADFMDGLAAEGFALLVGPLEGTRDALLIVRATDEQEIHDRLSSDPWTLRIGSLQ